MTLRRPRMHKGARGSDKGYTGATGTKRGTDMGIADRIYEVVRGMPDPEARKILQFAENVRARSVTVAPAQRQVNLALFRQYRGRYDGVRIDREALYDRAGVR